MSSNLISRSTVNAFSKSFSPSADPRYSYWVSRIFFVIMEFFAGHERLLRRLVRDLVWHRRRLPRRLQTHVLLRANIAVHGPRQRRLASSPEWCRLRRNRLRQCLLFLRKLITSVIYYISEVERKNRFWILHLALGGTCYENIQKFYIHGSFE